MRAVFLDFGTVSHDDLDTTQLERVLPGITLHATSTDTEVDERIAGVEFILTNKLNITRARMRAVPGLRFIGLTATGTNNVDLEAARELGIAVCNIREYCTVSVTQHVLGSILLLTHRFREYGQAAVDGTWSQSEQFTVPGAPIRELTGKVLGIVGYGVLGQSVAKAARDALGMRVLVAKRQGGGSTDSPPGSVVRCTLDELLRTADVLSLHCPLTQDNANMLNAATLATMRPGAIVVNTARGGLIDEAALADALRSGALRAAGLDSFQVEPFAAGHPFTEIPNVILSPHIGGVTSDAYVGMGTAAARNVLAVLAQA